MDLPLLFHYLVVLYCVSVLHFNHPSVEGHLGSCKFELRVPWTAKRSNQTILKEINPEYSLKVLLLELELQYIGHLMQSADSLEKTLMLEKIEDRRRRGQQRTKWLDDITKSIAMSLSKLREIVKDREAWHAAVRGVAQLDVTEWLNNNNE